MEQIFTRGFDYASYPNDPRGWELADFLKN